jgi:hypothetical protein
MTARVKPEWALRYSVNRGEWRISPIDFPEAAETLPTDGQVAIDFRCYATGPLPWPPDDRQLIPRHLGAPDHLDHSGEPKLGFRAQVLVRHYGLAAFHNSARTTLRVMERLYAAFCRAPEAQRFVRSYAIDAAEPFTLKHRTEPYFRPQIRPIGWLERRDEWFGEPLSPPPRQQQLSFDQLFDERVARAGDVLAPPRQSATTRWDDDDAA